MSSGGTTIAHSTKSIHQENHIIFTSQFILSKHSSALLLPYLLLSYIYPVLKLLESTVTNTLD